MYFAEIDMVSSLLKQRPKKPNLSEKSTKKRGMRCGEKSHVI